MKRKIIISLIFILLISVGIIYKVNTSFTNKIYLNEDNITNIKQQVGIYVENENGTYEKANNIPSQEEGYILDTENSMCEGNTTIEWDNNSWSAVINNIEKENLKCYLYFRSQDIIEKEIYKSLGTSTLTGTSCESSCKLLENGIYTEEDDYGISYVYRGTVDNNWVKFGQATNGEEQGDIWWRIIRINGNGSIRLIYSGTYESGTTPNAKDEKNLIYPTNNAGNNDYPRAVKFNEQYNDNKYVGYMYNASPEASKKFDDAHKVTSDSEKSTMLTQIELWWNQTTLGTLQDNYIDIDVGFCSDTQLNNTGEIWLSADGKDGYGKLSTAYAAYGRMLLNGNWRSEQYPTLKCGVDPNTKIVDLDIPKRDLYTYIGAQPVKTSSGTVEGNNALPIPVGLITADEVELAGGFGGKANDGYWLNVDKSYWTMSPGFSYSAIAQVFYVDGSGVLNYENVHNNQTGIRPVINLKSNVKITGTGTTTDPYIVK